MDRGEQPTPGAVRSVHSFPPNSPSILPHRRGLAHGRREGGDRPTDPGVKKGKPPQDGHGTDLVPRPATLEDRVHHSDLQVAQNLVFSNEEVTCATAYAFERSRMKRAIAC